MIEFAKYEFILPPPPKLEAAKVVAYAFALTVAPSILHTTLGKNGLGLGIAIATFCVCLDNVWLKIGNRFEDKFGKILAECDHEKNKDFLGDVATLEKIMSVKTKVIINAQSPKIIKGGCYASDKCIYLPPKTVPNDWLFAHEMSHIRNKDAKHRTFANSVNLGLILTTLVALTPIRQNLFHQPSASGLAGLLFGTVAYCAISAHLHRRIEYRADREAAQATSAEQGIQWLEDAKANPALNAKYKNRLLRSFLSQPTHDNRIKALQRWEWSEYNW